MKKRELSKEEMFDLIDFLGNKKETYGVMALVSALMSNKDFSVDKKDCKETIRTMALNKENNFEIVSCIMAIVIVSDNENARKWLNIFKLPTWNKDFFFAQYILGYILAIMSITNWLLEKEGVAKKGSLIIDLNSALLAMVPKLSLTDSLVFKEASHVFLYTKNNSLTSFEGHLTSAVKKYVKNNPDISLKFMHDYCRNMKRPTGTTTKLGDLIVEQMAYAEFNKLNPVQKAEAILKIEGE